MSWYDSKYKQYASIVDYSIGLCRKASGKPVELLCERYRHWGLMETIRRVLGIKP